MATYDHLSSPVAFPTSAKSPSKDEHPYAIKSTATAILTRSNSTSGNSQRPRFYSPVQASTNAPALGRSQSRGHRHSRSLSNATPPLPLPLPSPGSEQSRMHRRDSVPSSPLPGGTSIISDLPENPKLWTPSQLSLYLTSALRLRGDGSIPAPVANDIGAFVLREKLGGRAFLRLNDENLASMGINRLWREALLAASKTLKKKVLQGRIWGYGSTIPAGEDETPAKLVEEPVDLPTKSPREDNFRPITKYRSSGRVRGMIENLERRGSSASSEGSEDGVTFNTSMEASDSNIERELKAMGLWIEEEQEGDLDLAGNLTSSSASSDNEAVYETQIQHHSPELELPPLAHSRSVNTSDEPSIEELLAQEEHIDPVSIRRHPSASVNEAPSFGALAWENDPDIMGGTAKRITESAPHTTPAKPNVIDGRGSMRIEDVFQTEAKPQFDPFQMLQDFRERLDKMEAKLAILEKRDEEREKELTSLRQERLALEQSAAAEVEEGESADKTLSDQPQKRSEESEGRKELAAHRAIEAALVPYESNNKDPADPNPTELPSYVLLVSLGVCAVVLRVLFRNISRGRRG